MGALQQVWARMPFRDILSLKKLTLTLRYKTHTQTFIHLHSLSSMAVWRVNPSLRISYWVG